MNPIDWAARKPAFAPAGRFGTSAGKGNTACSFLILSQEPWWLWAAWLYETAAFCPAFNANRTGEIRSEHCRACPFSLKPAWASTGGKTLKGPH